MLLPEAEVETRISLHPCIRVSLESCYGGFQTAVTLPCRLRPAQPRCLDQLLPVGLQSTFETIRHDFAKALLGFETDVAGSRASEANITARIVLAMSCLGCEHHTSQ